ncbi:hypothetical protein THAOC_09707 [Thalassiosira oceanica]|uniref:Uncharacterized protein n=1 Tax=Thalassiosira oceanica TaxID=159749 RepID=K0T6Y3_THAOC|nr:hypothetical protein THAOC_09707 [Thalassiosira oceanica]|eukprot:EJK69076.1 hypothetical protein THAOC_09707 [Thalassiosira oceanica]
MPSVHRRYSVLHAVVLWRRIVVKRREGSPVRSLRVGREGTPVRRGRRRRRAARQDDSAGLKGRVEPVWKRAPGAIKLMHAAARIKKLPAAKTQRRRYYITTRQSSKSPRCDWIISANTGTLTTFERSYNVSHVCRTQPWRGVPKFGCQNSSNFRSEIRA